MQVVVDANAIIADYWLRSSRWRLLLRRAELNLVGLNVPEVVLAEVLNHYRTDLADAANATTTASSKAGRVIREWPNPPNIDVEEEIARYEAALREKLTAVGASFEYPPIDAHELATMAVSRTKPFGETGTGLVDAIVWLRVRELAAVDDVALISDDSGDFGGDRHGGLHPELQVQLEALALQHSVTRFPTPTQFHVAALDGRDELYHGEIERLVANPESYAGIKRAVWPVLEDRLAREAAAWGSIAGADDTHLDQGDVGNIRLFEVTDAEADEGYAVFHADAEGQYQFPVLFSEAWEAAEDGRLDQLDFLDPDDVETDLAWATRTVRLQLVVDARYNARANELADFELAGAWVTDRPH